MPKNLKFLIDFHRDFYYRFIYFEFKPDDSLDMTFPEPLFDKFDIRDIF